MQQEDRMATLEAKVVALEDELDRQKAQLARIEEMLRVHLLKCPGEA